MSYEPSEDFKHEPTQRQTPRPELKPLRAQLLLLMSRYSVLDYELSLLEIQKLAYFLQTSGEPMKLRYQKLYYGPYADNLNMVLSLLEGHYIAGYTGDHSPQQAIALLPHTASEALTHLKAHHPEAMAAIEAVSELIEGFETPHGMELLSSVHWLVTQESQHTLEGVIAAMGAWTPRKRQQFTEPQIKIAWEHLQQTGWLDKVCAVL